MDILIFGIWLKKIFKVLNTNGCLLANIILWCNKYLMADDYNNLTFKINDMRMIQLVI